MPRRATTMWQDRARSPTKAAAPAPLRNIPSRVILSER